MPNEIFQTLASSSAHGISRAAATKSIPLRVAWVLLFFCFLGLFCNSAVDRLEKLINVSIVTVREDNKVQFQFPDLYFCPSNPISGSYPYTLNASEAAIVNDEVERLGQLYDGIMTHPNSWGMRWQLRQKANMIFKSMSHNARKLLLQRAEQSILPNLRYLEDAQVTTVLTELNGLCFKYSLGERRENILKSKASSKLYTGVDLFTDPYNPHFNYTGQQLKPIVYRRANRTLPVHLWDFQTGIREDMATSGFMLILEGKSKLPSVFMSRLHLAPGRAYYIALSMEQVEFSKELHHEMCSPDGRTLAFVDPITGGKIEYNNSYQACLYDTYVRNLHRDHSYVMGSIPIPWDLRDSPRSDNLTDIYRLNSSSPWERWEKENILNLIAGDEADQCETLRPCVYPRYKAERFSSMKWPTFTGKYSDALRLRTGVQSKPAMEQLIAIAEELDRGNYSTHTEAIFHKFVSDSMLRVYISADSPRSPRLLISRSYSVTAFLADIGGLLGLYIGCSLLTFFEIFELLYYLMRRAGSKRPPRRDNFCLDEELTPVTGDELTTRTGFDR